MMDVQDFIDRERDYTVRLGNEDLPDEDCYRAFYLHFDGNSCIWILNTLKRIHRLRTMSNVE